jgi:hypothetical protein
MARLGLAVPPSDDAALEKTEQALAADDADAQDHKPDPTPTDTPGTRIDA